MNRRVPIGTWIEPDLGATAAWRSNSEPWAFSFQPPLLILAIPRCEEGSNNRRQRWNFSGHIVVLIWPKFHRGPSVRSSAQSRTDGLHFFFSFALSYLKSASEPASGAGPSVSAQMQEKLLAVPTLIVQNDRVWSRVTRRANASDRAEIGRISQPLGEWPQTVFEKVKLIPRIVGAVEVLHAKNSPAAT